jgi:hypothetical protein
MHNGWRACRKCSRPSLRTTRVRLCIIQDCAAVPPCIMHNRGLADPPCIMRNRGLAEPRCIMRNRDSYPTCAQTRVRSKPLRQTTASMLDSAMQFCLSCFYFFNCLIRLHAFHYFICCFLNGLHYLNFKRLKVRGLMFERLAVFMLNVCNFDRLNV